MTNSKTITVDTAINASIEKVWEMWNNPEHIVGWNFASDDWECPKAENDLRVGGELKVRMAAKDGSDGFDFVGKYTNIIENELIEYVLDDGRKVSITFVDLMGHTTVSETFDMENKNSRAMQEAGWQAILNNFKEYVESN